METDLREDPRDTGVTSLQNSVGAAYTKHLKWPKITDLHGKRWSTLLLAATLKRFIRELKQKEKERRGAAVAKDLC